MRASPKIASRVAVARARLAGASQNPNTDTTELKRELKHARAEDFLQRILAEAPPLTEDQRADLAALLVPAGGVAA